MEKATLVTIPTIVHLMLAEDSVFPEHNKEVAATEELFPKFLAPADHQKNVNSIWNQAGVQFRLDGIDTVKYHLKDFGAEPGVNREEITFACSAPPTEEEKKKAHEWQDKFGIKGFRGLQVFVLARIISKGGDAAMAGCAISQLDGGVTGSAWLDAPGARDSTGVRLMAHEIGHFLSLRHVQDPTHLMNADSQGNDLSPDEIKQASKRAVDLMTK